MKKIKLFEEFLNESNNFDESSALQELTDYTRDLLSKINHTEKPLNNGNGITFYRVGANEFSIDINKMGNGYVHLNIFSQIEVSSQSLADPKKAYQTTSARIVKHKKSRFRELFNDVDKAKKKISAFILKLTKI